jgi:hypothetical protein
MRKEFLTKLEDLEGLRARVNMKQSAHMENEETMLTLSVHGYPRLVQQSRAKIDDARKASCKGVLDDASILSFLLDTQSTITLLTKMRKTS